jgi:hypothetical protein
MGKEVTIDQSKVVQMAANPGLVELLPPLRTLLTRSPARKPCKCGSKAQTIYTYSDKDAALRELAAVLSADAGLRAEIKRRLGADTLRIKYKKLGESMMVVKKL